MLVEEGEKVKDVALTAGDFGDDVVAPKDEPSDTAD